jgi:hypothetical protein
LKKQFWYCTGCRVWGVIGYEKRDLDRMFTRIGEIHRESSPNCGFLVGEIKVPVLGKKIGHRELSEIILNVIAGYDPATPSFDSLTVS